MTTTIVLVGGVVLAIGEFLLFGALAEAYRDISQLRRETGTADDLGTVDLGAALHQPPSAYGLESWLDAASQAVALFVDLRCGTCQLIVESLNGSLPRGTVLTVFGDSEEDARDWLADKGFSRERVDELPITIATPGWPNLLGVDVTPLAVEIEYGRIARAFTIPSVRRFYNLVPSPHQLRGSAVSVNGAGKPEYA